MPPPNPTRQLNRQPNRHPNTNNTTSSLPPPEITITSPPLLPSPLLFYTSLKSFLSSHNLSPQTSPSILLLLGLLLRTVLSYILPPYLSSPTLLFLAIYTFLGWKKDSEISTSKLETLKTNQKNLQNELHSTKKESRLPFSPSFHKNSPSIHSLDDNKRNLHPELFSTMDDIDGVIIPRRKKGGRKLYEGRRKGRMKNGK
mmetsp:Transcript_13974/g.25621  ORF Transcript_13974/g.25621 Transcript_13974/m.25621 type:complete len:200 (+) Transcript_13974:216-815(+)